MYRVIFCFAIVFFLSACAQTDLQRPVAPVPAKWEQTGQPPGVNSAVTHWRTFFTDLRLRALVEAALDNNRDLRMAVARVQEARAQYGVVRADRVPTVSLGPPTGTPITTGYTAPLISVSYELDFWGRISGMTEVARYSFLATEDARRAVQLTLVADVANAYYEILQLEELISLLRATVDLREYAAELLGKGRDLGAANDNDYLQATVALESGRSSLAALSHQRTVAVNRLNFLVGKTGVVVPEGKSIEEPGFDSMLRPGIPSEVLLFRPDVMASEQRLRAANANINVARSAFFPKIAITAGFGAVGGGFASLFKANAAALAPVVSLPALWDGGRVQGGVDAAQARLKIAVAEYEKTIQQAFREVADQLSARESLAKQIRAASANKAAQERRLQIAHGRFDGGVAAYREVIDGQQDLLLAQQAVISLRKSQMDAEVQLYKALGGGEQRAERL
jgi:multidrug efflux system outer membrane protein